MTITYVTPTSFIIAASGNGITMAGGDLVNVVAGGYVGTKDGFGSGISLTSTGSGSPARIFVNGDVSGNAAGITLASGSSLEADINIGAHGTVYSATGAAIAIDGGLYVPNLYIVNSGEIETGASAAIKVTHASLNLINSGIISAWSGGNAITAAETVTSLDIRNTGALEGNVFLVGSGDTLFYNAGVVFGSLTLGTLANGFDTLEQHGTVHGDVAVLASGVLKANLSHGQIDGKVDLTGGSGSTADFSGGTFLGKVTLTGIGAWTLGFSGAEFLGGLALPTANQNLDLTGVSISRGFTIGDGVHVIDFHSGIVRGSFVTGSGADTVDITGAQITGEIDLKGGNDQFIGGDGAERILDGLGDDDYALGGGNDTLVMGSVNGTNDGNDTFDGGAGSDTISLANVFFAVQAAGAWISLAEGMLHDPAGSNVTIFGNDEITGFENVLGSVLADQIYGDGLGNRLVGRDGSDFIFGDAGADTLRGGSGADTLIGGTGRDMMTGGTGADVFQFLASNETGASRATRDTILDFQSGSDRISVTGIDANSVTSGIQAFSFAGQVATSGAGTVRYVFDHGDTIVQFNTNATNAAEFTLLLHGTLTLTAADFIFV